MKRINVSKLSAICITALAISSCSNEEYRYNSQKVEELAKEGFQNTFVKAFGNVAADQSWDFAGSPLTSIAGTSRNSRAAGIVDETCTPDNDYPYLDADGYFDIPASMQVSLNVLKENQNNSSVGNTYALSVPDNNFSIIPIRQGYTASPYELHMVVGEGDDAVDYLLWKKGDYMQTRKAGTTNAWKKVSSAENSYTYGNFDVRSKVLTFKNMTPDAPMYFYIYRPTTSLYPSSLDGYMKDYTSIVTLPEQLVNDGKKIKVIGAEAQMVGTDFDYEDVMFMIVGDPTLPEDITPDEKMKFTQTISKRYMIEDLGETDDTDYNDIVVDLESSRSITFEYNPENGMITNRTYGQWGKQKAIIRHLGGMLSFQLTIGDTTLPWMPGQMNVSPNTVYDVTGWVPETNNISILVRQSANNQGVNSLTFPAAGSIPLIIATNTSQPWMAERQSIIPVLKNLIINQKSE